MTGFYECKRQGVNANTVSEETLLFLVNPNADLFACITLFDGNENPLGSWLTHLSQNDADEINVCLLPGVTEAGKIEVLTGTVSGNTVASDGQIQCMGDVLPPDVYAENTYEDAAPITSQPVLDLLGGANGWIKDVLYTGSKAPSNAANPLTANVVAIEKTTLQSGASKPTQLLATGQMDAFQADKNDGVNGPVDVADDGTLELGVPLSYMDNGLTVIDLNTGLEWEKKVVGSACLHCVDDQYRWSGNGSQETIWDWLDDVNAEGGTGFAGHNDWRIPNRRELESIVDAGRFNPSIDPTFGPTVSSFYWSSTTYADNPIFAWGVNFFNGNVNFIGKTNDFHVRAVRGGG